MRSLLLLLSPLELFSFSLSLCAPWTSMRFLLLLLSPLGLRELILCSPNVLESNPCCFSCRPPGYRRWFPLRRYKASVSIPQLQSEELKARIRASSILTFQQATSMRSLLLLLSPLELRELILCSPNVLEVILAVFRAGLHGIDVGFH
ncbi:hypothetical protein IHE45_11G006300 [Dioscorea alata]|uniref:Uncharacterized protein n=1 Tax=Dioscorea alata TaxID=55571 RepID=A0ACB7V4Q8_DIOAL|nr:hypothetical protein IHE45_11G006300 [Dioscorea alata]